MKTTDLMIGDWVLINNIPHKIQAIDSIDAEIQADDELYYVGEDRNIANVAEESYIAGATEQKAIENNKARKAFNAACGWLFTYSWYNAVVEEFIKNIEE